MRTIRASEIGTYLYCQRSWWYRLTGVEPENKRELQAGTSMHYAHGRVVAASTLLSIFAGLAVLSALALGIYTLIVR